MPGARSAGPALTEACAFGVEVAMLVLLAVTGTKISSTLAVHVTLAILFPVVALGLWGIWAAPASRRRLNDPWRLVAQIVLFVLTAVLAAVAHLLIWGVNFAVVAVIIFSLTRLFPSRPVP
jgi:hypothetical protein